MVLSSVQHTACGTIDRIHRIESVSFTAMTDTCWRLSEVTHRTQVVNIVVCCCWWYLTVVSFESDVVHLCAGHCCCEWHGNIWLNVISRNDVHVLDTWTFSHFFQFRILCFVTYKLRSYVRILLRTLYVARFRTFAFLHFVFYNCPETGVSVSTTSAPSATCLYRLPQPPARNRPSMYSFFAQKWYGLLSFLALSWLRARML